MKMQVIFNIQQPCSYIVIVYLLVLLGLHMNYHMDGYLFSNLSAFPSPLPLLQWIGVLEQNWLEMAIMKILASSILQGKLSTFSNVCNVCSLPLIPIHLGKFPYIPSLRIFIVNGCWILAKLFASVYPKVIPVSFSFVQIIDFQIESPP